MSGKNKGTLIIIGGKEQKENGDRPILKEVARRARRGNGRLVVLPVASSEPEDMAQTYKSVFKELRVPDVEVVQIRKREDAHSDVAVEKVRGASVIFFTGGDQLRITSQLGDSPVFRCLNEILEQGGTIAGTSAGAAAIPETMLIAGPSDESNRISALDMAPGLGLLAGTVIDSHFAERGRFGRLLGAVAQNPKNLGLGLDEDTAIVIEHEADCFSVLGSGAVYVVDGTAISYSSLSEENPEGILSLFNVKLHILAKADKFSLRDRAPVLTEEMAMS